MRLQTRKIAWVLALVPLLLSCSNEEEQQWPQEPPVETGEAVLKIKMVYPSKKSATYADTDFPATDAEKEIKSIAFFTQNADEGTGVDFKHGAFNRFLSTEDLRTPTGLYEPLNETNDAYTTTIKIRSDGFGDNKVKVLVIANYAENGLTQALKDTETWTEVTNLASLPLDNNPKTPLLMVALEEEVPLTNGGTSDFTFDLHRLVSRIDVINKATTSSFELISAQLINPREKSYLVANHVNKDKVALATDEFDAVLPNPLATPNPAIESIYTYENTNSDPTKATAILVKGKYSSYFFEKKITLKHPDKDGVAGEVIPLLRNHRYVINIVPSSQPNDIDWTVKVANWDDGEEVAVNPPADDVPVLADFTFEDGTDDWYPDALVYNIENHLGKQLSFTVTNATTTKYTVSYRCLEKHVATAFGLHDKNSDAYQNFVQRDAPVITYAQVEQKYTVNIPPLLNEPTAPIIIVLSIENATNRNSKQEVVFVYNKTNYPGTSLKPVLLGGRYWAPINAGATQLGNVLNSANMGKVYQWGRNLGFDLLWNTADNTAYPANTQEAGPKSYAIAGVDTYLKFVSVPNGSAPQSTDWLTVNDPQRQTRDLLWSPSVNNSPCPIGWRVPTLEEWIAIANVVKERPYAVESYRIKIQGDQEDYLYLPKMGHRNGTTGNSYKTKGDNSSVYYYWSSNFNTSKTTAEGAAPHPIRIITDNTPFVTNTTNSAAHGFAIRCIQQDVEDGRS